MANTIRIKRSTGSSNPNSMANAEVAFREGDEVLIYDSVFTDILIWTKIQKNSLYINHSLIQKNIR